MVAKADGSAPLRQTERKARTRQALVDAALNLVAAHGFDAITADEIAAAAGVSPRTFFRHFATKEQVLLFGEDDFVTSFTGVYLAQPPELDEVSAIAASFTVLAPGVSRLHHRIRLYHRALASSPVLRGQEQVHLDENVARVAEAIARRRQLSGVDPACTLLAEVSMTTLQHLMSDWAAGPARVDLGRLVEHRFSLLVDVVNGRR